MIRCNCLRINKIKKIKTSSKQKGKRIRVTRLRISSLLGRLSSPNKLTIPTVSLAITALITTFTRYTIPMLMKYSVMVQDSHKTTTTISIRSTQTDNLSNTPT